MNAQEPRGSDYAQHHPPSVGFHTIAGLYEHKHLLFCLVIAEDPLAWKSLRHADDSPTYDGWFLAGTTLGDWDITYHLPLNFWPLCHAEEVPIAPAWDGHTPQDVCDRIHRYLQELKP